MKEIRLIPNDFIHHGKSQILFGREMMVERTLGQAGMDVPNA